MIIGIKSKQYFYVPTVLGDLMNHWRFPIATEARLEARCCLRKSYIVQRVAIRTARLTEIWSVELGKSRQKRIKATILVRSEHTCQLECVSSWCESRLAYFAAKLTWKGGKISVPATSVTPRDPGYSSSGKVLARASAVASCTEMISHCTAVHDGRKFTLELVHLSERRGR